MGCCWGQDRERTVAHPESGLTPLDIRAVQRTWAPIYSNKIANGHEILKRVFRAEPKTKQYFWMVRDKPEEELMQVVQFRAHIINLMTALNMLVCHLDHPDLAIAMLQKLGQRHKKIQVKEKHFVVLKSVLMTMFAEDLKFDHTTLSAWSKTLNFFMQNIFSMLDS